MPELESKALRFPFAGTATFIKRAEDGTNSEKPEDIYTTGRNVMGAVNTTFSLAQTNLEDENSNYPAAIYTTGTTDTVAIVFRTEDPDLDMFLKGTIKTDGTDVGQWHSNLSYPIGDDGKVTLKDPDGGALKISESGTVLVRDYMTNADYAEASGASPTGNEYTVDPATATFTFDVANKGKQVLISCELVADTAIIYTDSAQAKSQTMSVILSGPAEDYTETNPMWVTRTYDSMQLSGDYSPLSRQKAPGEKTVNMTTTKPRGNKAVETIYSKRLIDTTKE